MRTIVSVAALSSLICLAVPACFAGAPPSSKSAAATVTIVFKDGHRQAFNLADIARIEFPGGAEVSAPASANLPSRGRFLGKWKVGDGQGTDFYITLDDSGDAKRSIGDMHGKWIYVNGEAHVTWDDGAQDAIRRIGSSYHKYAYSAEKSFTDTPDNVTDAHNTTPHSI
ncbi:MAG: hypothetical protein ABSG51_01810 [Terracidiphilus sp.]|jgi:hypothetical protein